MIDDPILINDWHPVASLAQLTERPVISVHLMGEELVIWRTGEQIQAWQNLCIHRGAKLSLGKVTEDGQLRCAYHGWTYNREGRCTQIPAHPEQVPPSKAHAKPYRVIEKYGLVWVSLGEPTNDPPPFPEAEKTGYGVAICGPYTGIRATGPRLIENFLDAAHFPFVHEGVLGDPNQPAIGDYEARITANGVESDPVSVYQPGPYRAQAGEVQYIYHAYRPLTAHFTKLANGATNGLLLTITPHDEMHSSAWFIVATTAITDSQALQREYEPRIRQIFEQDREVVESQRPELLPLDLQAELHLKSDRVAIAYRQWLKELGLRYGCA